MIQMHANKQNAASQFFGKQGIRLIVAISEVFSCFSSNVFIMGTETETLA